MKRRSLLGLITIAPLAFVMRVPEAHADAIAQARADGYNRGREIEAARIDSRQEPYAAPGTVVIGSNVSISGARIDAPRGIVVTAGSENISFTRNTVNFDPSATGLTMQDSEGL